MAMNVRSVLITGTTSGVGRALLEHYVKSGVKVISVNRRRVADVESHYPSVRFECVDVRCAEDVDKLVRSLADAGDYIGALFWTDAALFAGAGIPTVVFGPAGEGAHAAVEWVSLASLERVREVVVRVAAEWCA